ncbi:hypothetical protein J4Q44_G00219700 [Coregonus suidteri]|uniref:Uncharacterized protein n=1 Tax=Coregonus suidteri TaxID=861788 RepID=A0AAN8LEB5_9TELE
MIRGYYGGVRVGGGLGSVNLPLDPRVGKGMMIFDLYIGEPSLRSVWIGREKG